MLLVSNLIAVGLMREVSDLLMLGMRERRCCLIRIQSGVAIREDVEVVVECRFIIVLNDT